MFKLLIFTFQSEFEFDLSVEGDFGAFHLVGEGAGRHWLAALLAEGKLDFLAPEAGVLILDVVEVVFVEVGVGFLHVWLMVG